MKKDYNRNVMADVPLDASLDASTQIRETKKPVTKPKINAIGKKANSQVQGKTTKTTTKTTAKTQTQKSKTNNSRLNASEINDLEKLNEENFRTFQTKSKRNKFVIILLVVSIICAIAVISVYLALTKLKTNCDMYAHGADAVYYINGEKMSEFRTPASLQGNSILQLDIKIKIEESGMFDVKFKPECFQSGKLLNNTLIYYANLELFYEGGDGYYYSKRPIEGNQTITLCGGIILDYDYKDTLTNENFRMEFHTYFDKVAD